jgi:thiamine pyrophosphokinase
MNDLIVSTISPVTVVGGGDATVDALLSAIVLAPRCLAADGGAALAVQAEVSLEAVIGDFDSVTPEVLDQIPAHRQHRITEQMTTDFEKVLLRVQTPLVIGVGFLGGRLDHELAAFHTLLAYAHQPCILLGDTQIVFLAPSKIGLPAQVGDLVSLFPLCDVTGQSKGLTWPIGGLAFAPGHKIGTSNSAEGPFEVQMDGPGMLMILPKEFMPSVVAAFLQSDHVRWPVRAR